MRRFIVVGHRAVTTAEFPLNDLAGAAGRMDLLLNAANAALLVSHDLRRDVEVTLLLLGPPDPPRAIRILGERIERWGPDIRGNAALIRRALEHGSRLERETSPGIFAGKRSLEGGLGGGGGGGSAGAPRRAAGGRTRHSPGLPPPRRRVSSLGLGRPHIRGTRDHFEEESPGMSRGSALAPYRPRDRDHPQRARPEVRVRHVSSWRTLRTFERPRRNTPLSPPRPIRKWSCVPKNRPCAMTVRCFVRSRCSSAVTSTSEWGK